MGTWALCVAWSFEGHSLSSDFYARQATREDKCRALLDHMVNWANNIFPPVSAADRPGPQWEIQRCTLLEHWVDRNLSFGFHTRQSWIIGGDTVVHCLMTGWTKAYHLVSTPDRPTTRGDKRFTLLDHMVNWVNNIFPPISAADRPRPPWEIQRCTLLEHWVDRNLSFGFHTRQSKTIGRVELCVAWSQGG